MTIPLPTPIPWKAIGKLVAALILGGFLLGAFLTIKGWRDDSIALAAKSEAQAGKAVATSEIASALGPALAAGQAQSATVASNRVVAEVRFEEMKRARPDTVGTWADSPIPLELRLEERARRLALDGPAADPPGGEAPDREARGRGTDPAPR